MLSNWTENDLARWDARLAGDDVCEPCDDDVRCHCCGAAVAADAADWDEGEPYCEGCRDAH